MDVKLSKRQTARTGFTLVELLVVIAIIALLASLIIVGGAAAIRAAKRAIITSEIRQMQEQLKIYYDNCGNDYPPDCVDLATDTKAQQAVVRHFEKRFTKYRPGNWDRLRLDAYNATSGLNETNPDNIDPAKGMDLNKLSPASAFAFFLGGMPDGGKPTGFSANPNNPFVMGGRRIDPSFEFDETRYEVINGVPVYYPKYIESPNGSGGVPYIYFKARGNGYSGSVNVPGTDTCYPYARTKNPKADWYEPKGFQIITPGLDGEFGDCSATDSLTPNADDNLTSFAPGQLKDVAE